MTILSSRSGARARGGRAARADTPASQAVRRRRAPRVCVIRQYYYPLDIRVRREVEALLAAGVEVDVICLRAPGESPKEQHGRLRIYRLPMAHVRGSRAGYLGQYAGFLVLASTVATLLQLRRRYEVVQIHSLPDTLVLAGVVPRLLGARLVLDLHEVMPEFFATKFGRPLSHPLVRLVIRAEQFSIRIADRVLTCTEQMREAFISRGANAEKITVVLNSADESLFDAGRFPPAPQPESFTLICHGTIEERYGLDTVVEALALLQGDIPHIRFQVYGRGAYRDELTALATRVGVRDRLDLSEGFVPMDDLLAALSHAHAGVVAMKKDAFRDLTHCNKMYEFLTLRVPVICSRTRSVNEYFSAEALQYFVPGDAEDLARAIREVYTDPARRKALVAQGLRELAPYRWDRQRAIYLRVIDSLFNAGFSVRPTASSRGIAHPEPRRS